eukprot:CAMPEP_0171520966 /NCGR_PEP_ID=MMETSP0959-20130129/6849_1 /TAXON_ID=87120 /ORGANISM="Aurantiochytrium limacinum, Strain ATCCMYA-1381" /LENGTH=61 /DNA_ID=CAMNT_0012060773 /DNA_START=572 /DNA_END=753 /DNA_ORIENTATION=-
MTQCGLCLGAGRHWASPPVPASLRSVESRARSHSPLASRLQLRVLLVLLAGQPGSRLREFR